MSEETTVKKGRISWTTVGAIAGIAFLLLTVIFLLVGSVFSSRAVTVGAEAAAAAYDEAELTAKQNMYNEFYSSAYEKSFENNKVSNNISISIGEVREMAKLEVLRVSTVQYIPENNEDNDKGITAWLEVPGFGVYTVDLLAGEYIIDNERKSVTVRVPEPVLEQVTIDYQGVERLFFNNEGFNESYRVGEEIARKQLKQGYEKIYNELKSDTSYYYSAISSAEKLIKRLIIDLNRNVDGLVVEVEFMK